MTAPRIDGIRKQRQRRLVIRKSILFKDLMPHIFGACQNDRNELAQFAFILEFSLLISIAFGVAVCRLCIDLTFGPRAFLRLSLRLSQLRRDILPCEHINDQSNHSSTATDTGGSLFTRTSAIIANI